MLLAECRNGQGAPAYLKVWGVLIKQFALGNKAAQVQSLCFCIFVYLYFSIFVFLYICILVFCIFVFLYICVFVYLYFCIFVFLCLKGVCVCI